MAPPKTSPLQCRHCSVAFAQLGLSTAHGEHLLHQRLCQGCDEDGSPLGIPSGCMVPGCQYLSPSEATASSTSTANRTLKAWTKHYKDKHDIKISEKCDHRSLRIRYKAHLLPSPDLKTHFGSFYSSSSVLGRYKDLTKLAEEEATDPLASANKMHQLLKDYRRQFW